MNAVVAKRALTVGMPGAGKTTFLAALWHVVESGAIESALKLAELPKQRGYLNEISRKWRNCEQQERTPGGITTEISLKLTDNQAFSLDVTFPDLSGESFESMWSDRQCTIQYQSWAKESSGILVFIHPASVRYPTLISEEIALSNAVTLPPEQAKKESDSTNKPVPSKETTEVAFDPRLSPTQVKLVDLVQHAIAQKSDSTSLRIAVIISAWDMVKSVVSSPKVWLEKEMPLLNQFLTSHQDAISFKIYGVSAFGGNPKTDIPELHKAFEPSNRIIVADGRDESHDVTAPLRWLMS